MPQLILRDVEFTLIRALRKRAAKNGRTQDEEHLAILKQALGDQASGSAIGGLMAAFGLSAGPEAPPAGPPPAPPAEDTAG